MPSSWLHLCGGPMTGYLRYKHLEFEPANSLCPWSTNKIGLPTSSFWNERLVPSFCYDEWEVVVAAPLNQVFWHSSGSKSSVLFNWSSLGVRSLDMNLTVIFLTPRLMEVHSEPCRAPPNRLLIHYSPLALLTKCSQGGTYTNGHPLRLFRKSGVTPASPGAPTATNQPVDLWCSLTLWPWTGKLLHLQSSVS